MQCSSSPYTMQRVMPWSLKTPSSKLSFFYSKVVDADQSRWCRRAFGHSISLSQEGGTDASCWTRTCFQKLWKQPNHVSNNQGVSIYSFGLFTMTKHWIIQSRCQSLFQRSFPNIFQMLKPWSPQIEPSPIPERQVNGLLEHSDSANWFAKTASNKQSAVLQLDCKIVQLGAGRISLKFNQLRVKSELIAESNPEQHSLAQSSQVSWSAREWEMVNSEILHRERG